LAGHAALAGVRRETALYRVPDGREVRGSMRVFSCTLLQLSCSARHLPLLAFHPAGQNIVCLFGRTASVSRLLSRMLKHSSGVSRWIGNVRIPCSLSMMLIERSVVRLPRRRELRGRSPSSCRWVLTLAIRHPTHITCRRKGVQCDGQKPSCKRCTGSGQICQVSKARQLLHHYQAHRPLLYDPNLSP